uniref:Uncharacterized protein n=1 Tax=Romanomermis culicivorax TaxID=13658 RepID=A0A915KX28_ROMCU
MEATLRVAKEATSTSNTYINGDRDTQFDYTKVKSVNVFRYGTNSNSCGNNDGCQYDAINVALDNS